MPRDEFTPLQRRQALALNAADVRSHWPYDLQLHNPTHYCCEECRFVHDSQAFFEVDHVVPCARGGMANRASEALRRAISQGDIEALMKAGVNHRVLCVGCNRAKGAREVVPRGAGYAFKKHGIDRNPDHRYHGQPKP